MANNNERNLVKRAKEGDKQAFAELVKLYSPRIYRTAIHIMVDPDEAEDMVQETFIKAYNALNRFDNRSTFFTWIYRILINLCLNRKKEMQKWQPSRDRDPRLKALAEEGETVSGETPEDKLNRKRTLSYLASAIDELSETLRTTLILVCFENMDYKQAGEILGCSEGTVAWRVFKAREILREKMKKLI